MKKFFLPFVVVLLIITFALMSNLFSHTSSITIRNKTFSMAIANTQQKKEIGLSSYASLPLEKGMYFPFDTSGYYTFWMKDMHFPIDILFLQNNKIVTIIDSAPTPTNSQDTLLMYKSSQSADAVLEINAGLSKKYGFRVGDSVTLTK